MGFLPVNYKLPTPLVLDFSTGQTNADRLIDNGLLCRTGDKKFQHHFIF